MASVPSIKLRDGNSIPQLGLGVWQVDPAITARVVTRRRSRPATGRSIRPRATQRGRRRRGDPAVRACRASELFITSKLRNGGHARDLALQELRRDHEEARDRAARPVPHPLAGAQPGQVCRGLEDAGGAAEAGADPLDRRLELQPGPSRADHRRNRGDAGGQPDRAASAVPAARQAGLPQGQHDIKIESWSPLGSGADAR